jgi:DNA repair protein RecO (recombination protein O)
LLTEAKLERRFRPARGDLTSLYAAYYVAELLGALTHDYDPHPELFERAEQTLCELARRGASASLVVRFELAALRLVGHLPSLADCAECGGPVAAAGRIPFGQLAGGVLCGKCRIGKRQVVSVSGPVIEALRRLADDDSNQAGQASLGRATYGEMRAVLNHYLAGLVGHEWRLHRYLASLADPADPVSQSA